MMNEVGKCTFANKRSCLFFGPGCNSVSQKSCPESERLTKALYEPCAAFPEGRCELARYRALLPKGHVCGSENECRIRSILAGSIPVQDFEVCGMIPGNYAGKNISALELRGILRESFITS